MKQLRRLLSYPWRAIRQADLVERQREEIVMLKLQRDLLTDREKNLRANLALILSEATRQAAEVKALSASQPTKRR